MTPLNVRLVSETEIEPIETELMRRTAAQTVAAVPDAGIVVWCGKSRIGKTKTAQWLEKRINKEFHPEDLSTYRAHYYQTGPIPARGGGQEKQAVRSLFAQVIGASLTEYTYRREPTERIAEQVARGLARKRLRMVFVDEAGTLSCNAIRGIVLVRDIAERLGCRTTFVLIGMDDLAVTVESNPQLRGRVHRMCYFEEYDLPQTKELLAGLHPHFGGKWTQHLDREAAFIHEQCGGFPGTIVYFLHQVEAFLKELDAPFDLTALQATRTLAVQDRKKAMADVRSGHASRADNRRGTQTAGLTP